MGGVRSGVDTARLSAAVSRPGIDPRIWLTLAIIKDLGFDPDEGLFADVQYQPDGQIETALVGSPYTADGGGLWCPLEIGDTVLVAVPMGDPGHGPVVIGQMWNKAQKPATEFGDDFTLNEPTSNVVWRIRNGKKLQILTKDGSVEITGEAGGTVKIHTSGTAPVEVTSATTVKINAPEILIGSSPGQPIARVGDIVSVVVPPMITPTGGPVAPLNPANAVLVPGGTAIACAGQIVSGKSGVKA